MRIKNKFKMFFAMAALLVAGYAQGMTGDVYPLGHASVEEALTRYAHIEDANWYPGLDSDKKAKVEAIYGQLERGQVLSPEHKRHLGLSLRRIHFCENNHEYSFTPEFINLLGLMPAPEASQFFYELFLITPVGKIGEGHKWFGVVSDFFCQLPDNEKNLASLRTLLTYHGIKFYKDGSNYVPEMDGTQKIRLRGLRTVLDIAERDQMRLDMAGLKALYEGPASWWDTLLGNTENVVETVQKGWIIIPVLPLLPFAGAFLRPF